MSYNKYHNKKTEKYNRVWDSEMELDFYENQCLPRLKSGEYISVETQVTFILQKGFKIDGKNILPIKYVADFVITTKKGNKIIVDTKGMPPTADFKLKWKMLVNLLKEEYKYYCIKGLGRNKRKGINYYPNWERIKGVYSSKEDLFTL